MMLLIAMTISVASLATSLDLSDRQFWWELAALITIMRLSKGSYRKMIQNLVWAAGYNVLAIPLPPARWRGPASSSPPPSAPSS